MTRQFLTKRCFLQERMLRSPQGRGLLRRLWYATTRLWAMEGVRVILLGERRNPASWRDRRTP
jgi:hypothetical protein